MTSSNVKYELLPTSLDSPTDCCSLSAESSFDFGSSSTLDDNQSFARDKDALWNHERDESRYVALEKRVRRAQRQRNILGLLTALVIVIGLLSSHDNNRLFAPKFVKTFDRTNSRDERLPSRRFASLSRGNWTLPSTLMSIDDIVKVYGMRPQGADIKRGPHRARQVASFTWQPEQAVRDWDTIKFVKRAFNSPKGFVLVGDSVTMQSFEALGGMGGLLRVASAETVTLNTTSYQWLTSRRITEDGDFGLFVKNGTKMQRYLMDSLPNVPRARFDQPFVRAIRSDLLLMPDEVEQVVSKPIEQKLKVKPSVAESVNALPWQQLVFGHKQEFALESWRDVQNSILLVNTGAHWNPICTGMNSSQDVQTLGKLVASDVLQHILSLERVNLIWRTTSMAHPDCDTAILPTSQTLPFKDHPDHMTDAPNRDDWSWSTFGTMSGIWTSSIDALAPRGTIDNGNKVAVLDIAELTSKRPDAHASAKDCLHWALPSVPATWIKLANHIMFELDQD
ncbi:hypothetical protein OIO90_006197 [Microbotryomycetes sp. JL221]|nr:hypothetical protein OIO90_006197 [Microbotryomycetes sp. JL221]